MIDFSNSSKTPHEFTSKVAKHDSINSKTAAAVFAATLMVACISGFPGAASADSVANSGDPVSGSSSAQPVNIIPTNAGQYMSSTDASAQPVNIVPAQARPLDEFNDPFEPVNRAVFAVNDGLDKVVIRPIATVYKAVLPTFVRRGIGNFLSNAATPITLANDVLQGEWLRAENTIVRFMLNTTAGVGGLTDVAKHVGYERHYEDFGQTLAVYGVPSGPYVVLPIFGPSTPRHVVGRAVDTFANPWTWLLADEETLVQLAPAAFSVVNARAESLDSLDAIRETSPDYYVSIRSLYTQSRESEIRNGEDSDQDFPDIPDVGN